MVEYGFARLPSDKEEKDREGYVVFYEDKKKDLMNYDEMKFSLCGKAQERTGRPAMTPLNPSLPFAGFSDDKSSKDCTLCIGFNFKDELLPVLVILPSAAKSGNHKLRYSILKGFHQHKGQYGLDREHYVDAEIAFSKKGLMTAELHHNFQRGSSIGSTPRLKMLLGCTFVQRQTAVPVVMTKKIFLIAELQATSTFLGFQMAWRSGRSAT